MKSVEEREATNNILRSFALEKVISFVEDTVMVLGPAVLTQKKKCEKTGHARRNGYSICNQKPAADLAHLIGLTLECLST